MYIIYSSHNYILHINMYIYCHIENIFTPQSETIFSILSLCANFEMVFHDIVITLFPLLRVQRANSLVLLIFLTICLVLGRE